MESDCSKNYSFFDSYRKHRITKHTSVTSRQEPNVSFKEEPIAFDFTQSSNVNENEALVYAESESSSDESEIFDEKCLEDENLIETTFNSSSVKSSCSLSNKICFFAAKMYKFPDISRQRVGDIICDVSSLWKNNIQTVQNEIHGTLVELGKDPLTSNEINDVLQKISSPFQKINTEALRFAHFKVYKIFDQSCYKFCLLNQEYIASGIIITSRNKLNDDYYYIPKIWI